MKGHAMRIDPVTLQIFANHAQAAADSMAFTLFRTALLNGQAMCAISIKARVADSSKAGACT